MQYNKYSAYSIVSDTEQKNQQDLQKTLNLIETLSFFNNHHDTKEFLKNTYKLNEDIQNFPLSSNGILSIVENKNKYTVKITYKNQNENECVVFSYIK